MTTLDEIKEGMAELQAKQDAWDARQRAAVKELTTIVAKEHDAATVPLEAAAVALITKLRLDAAAELAAEKASRAFEVERLKTAARADGEIAKSQIAELTATLTQLTEQYQWLAANALAVTFATEYSERMAGYCVPPLTNIDAFDCPMARAVEAVLVLLHNNHNMIDHWLHKRGWKHNGTGLWTDPQTGESSHIFNNALAIQRDRDVKPFGWMLERLK